MNGSERTLAELGWTDYFKQQCTGQELEDMLPARVVSMHRGHVVVSTGQGEHLLPVADKGILKLNEQPAVGDWVLLEKSTMLPARLLSRASVFKRLAPGAGRGVQPIAANIDTVFIVSSCTAEFNLNRLERYLCLALDSGVEPVVVLTKADLARESGGDSPQDYCRRAETIRLGMPVVAVNGHDLESVKALEPWCRPGQTIVLLGSSGVGKTTLVNALKGKGEHRTGHVRKGDGKGRHTTTRRTLHVLSSGVLLVDVPGIRELQLHDCRDGIERAFADIVELEGQCRFADCRHENEPDCAVSAALKQGEVDPRRAENYRKLLEEADEGLQAASGKQRRNAARAAAARRRGAGRKPAKKRR